jgi:hypothetical protein
VARRLSAAIASWELLVIFFATRSASSGGPAAIGSSSSQGETEPSRTSSAMMRAPDATLVRSCLGAAASWRRPALSWSTWAR